MTKQKLILLVLLVMVISVFLISGAWHNFTLEGFRLKQEGITAYFISHPVNTGIIFTAVYIVLTTLSLPVAGVMTVVSGAIFGFIWGLILVSIASSLGATLAFLLARYLFRDAVQRRFADRLGPVNDGIRNDGAYYLFMLRLIPVLPYFMVNATLALTPLRTPVFFIVTLIGMLPISAILVNAGMQIANISSTGDILSPRIILSLMLIGIFPLLVRKSIVLFRQRKTPVNSGRLPDDT